MDWNSQGRHEIHREILEGSDESHLVPSHNFHSKDLHSGHSPPHREESQIGKPVEIGEKKTIIPN